MFNQILRQHRHENALILLHDLEFEDLKHILEFIYTGKCEVRKDGLSRFLSCGTALGVKGLTENIDVEDEIDLEVEKNQQQVSKKTPSVKIIEENIEEDVVDYIEENIKEILEKNVEENYEVNNFKSIAEIIEKNVEDSNVENIEEVIQGTVETMKGNSETNSEEIIEEDDENIVGLCIKVETKIIGYDIAGVPVPTPVLGAEKQAENEPRNVCRECGFHPEVGHKSRSLQKHMEEVHKKEKRFSCSVCDYKTNRSTYLRVHHDGEHNGKRYKCDKCDVEVKIKSSLKSHDMMMHEKPYNCSECDYKTGSKVTMRSHEETMHRGVNYKCNQCEFDTKSTSTLYNHKRDMHSNVSIRCNLCDYSTKRPDKLKQHKQSVHQNIKFNCDLCDKKVKSLNQHKRFNCEKRNFHEPKPLNICNQCDFTTAASNSLQRHIEQIHEGVEYKCGICTYKTNINIDLKKHISRQHSEIDNFQCEQCSYSSRQKVHLDIHTKSKHKGEILLCHLCSYKATQLSNLKRHLNAKHSEK